MSTNQSFTVTPDGRIIVMKPGYKTSEFWTSLFTSGFMFGDTIGLWNLVPDEFSTVAGAIIVGLYSVSRGLAKKPS